MKKNKKVNVIQNTPKVSVIIPCYNMEKYLETCFKSVEKQTYKNLEIIFINDGSTDETLTKIKEFCNKAKTAKRKNFKVKYVDKQNGGISSARNAGIFIATGKYLYFYDPDDVLHPRIIEHFINTINKENADMVICDFKKVKDGKNYNQYRFCHKTNKKMKIYNKIESIEQYFSQKYFDFCVWNKLYRADILKENNIVFNENCRYGEETYFNFCYLKLINKVVYIKDKLYYYVQRKNSAVHQKFNEKRLEAFLSLNANIQDCKINVPEVLKYAFAIRTMVCCEMIYFIFKSKYNNVAVINKIYFYFLIGIPYLKKCKRITLFRRLFIPLVPLLIKIMFKKRIKNGDNNSKLPLSMQI